MLSKNTVKFIKSLHQKKFRRQEQAFFVEGAKNVTELLRSDYTCTHLLYTDKFAASWPDMVAGFSGDKVNVLPTVLKSLGTFSSNDQAMALAISKPNLPIQVVPGELVLALDDIRDPGNLGTIIRIADWYGIKKMLLSPETADLYNPKVVHASMGSFTRLEFEYVALSEKLQEVGVPVFGAFLEGLSIHAHQGQADGILLMGNESHGISSELEKLVSQKLTIPAFGGAESLNVAVATAVLCDHLRRLRR
ncbi:RNA methyltransferase, TrmH family [Cyclobacterium xiamenense]|jgi:TrmH family RNA methyltransferase|uniref:RNA methyltransferase, TrmH family n=1 Tax=Cyclobacterium xiamenense TaxID=1297121 RepID=A0A1H6Z1P2_9BACT|nr:RNA methyltransferase [Cyclobacterium xiamenense]SEJ45307.1 RNA methyltransferase, TrmH family [Cyclobacterium xiamenense]